MLDTYSPERDIDQEFVETVRNWITESGEVLVVLRYLRAAGSRDYVLCTSADDFDWLVQDATPGTDIVVFSLPQLPVRGEVTSSLVDTAFVSIADGEEYLVAAMEESDRGIRISRNAYGGESHEELGKDLADLSGQEVALGKWPDSSGPGNENMISRAKGGIDGPR